MTRQPVTPRTPPTWRLNTSPLLAWLPSRGNMIFTLLVVFGFFLTNKAGAVSLGAPLASGASTAVIPYQGRLTNASNVPISGPNTMTFKLYNVASGGSALWTETQTITATNGLFNTLLGSTTPITQSIITGNSSLWLGVKVGADAEMAPRAQIGSVPYALQASSAYSLSASDGTPLQAVVVDANGNVGIGTLSPGSYKLNVQGGDVNFSGAITASGGDSGQWNTAYSHALSDGDTSASNEIQTLGTSGNTITLTSGGSVTSPYADSAGNSNACTNDSNCEMPGSGIWNSSGNVGIGTMSPLKKLHVDDNTTDQTALFSRSNMSVNGDQNAIMIGKSQVAEQSGAFGFRWDSDPTKRALFLGLTGHESLFINNSGNVGIGTVAPSAKLTVYGAGDTNVSYSDSDSKDAALLIADSGSAQDNGGELLFGAGGNVIGVIRSINEVSNAGSISFQTRNSGNLNERMRITYVGNVGIGTTDPSTKLVISGGDSNQQVGASINAALRLNNGDATGAGRLAELQFSNNAAPYAAISGYPENGQAMGHILFSTRENISDPNLIERMRITKDGAVLIGTTSASTILTIQQNSSSDPIADGWTTYSSKRWKTNIKTINNALDLVQQLRGVRFDWMADSKRDIGLVAEEVGQVIPEIVVYESNGVDALSVDYSRLVAVLIEAVKEQQTLIDGRGTQLVAQQQQIAKLQQQNTALEARLTALEQSAQAGSTPVANPLAGGWNTLLLGMVGGGLLVLAGLVVGKRYQS